jgi:hypothetical protein
MDSRYVTFDFSSGSAGLDMAAGSYFDLTGSSRLSDPGACRIVLGDNDLTGAGDFKTVDITKDSMTVSISGLGDVGVNALYMRTSDAFPGSVDIDVAGTAAVGSVDTQDQAAGGNHGGNVTIRAGDVTVASIDTRALRTNSSDRLSGNVVLEVRDYTGNNTLDNTITLQGIINTDAATGTDGSVTISGVIVTLEAGFSTNTGDGSLQIYAGMVQYGITAGDLFIDNSGGGYTAVHNVFWTGPGAESYASYPQPGYGADDVVPDAVLRWTPGIHASSHDVYLGTSLEDVNSAVDPNVLPGRGRQDVNRYTPTSLLEFATTYYWRVDEVNEPNIWKGTVWTFTTADGKAAGPSPADNASSTPIEVTLSWTPGVLAVSHDVYFGTDHNAVSSATTATPPDVYMGRQEANSLSSGALQLNSVYYWRVDEVGAETFVKGDVWSFKTAMAEIFGHSIVHGGPDIFCGWPANNGVWIWGNEILVGFVYGPYVEIPGHNLGSPSYTGLGRSLDGGLTWTMEDPNNFVGDGGIPVPSPGNINFAYPDFAWRTASYTSQGQFFFSYDRGHTWQGPYTCGDLMGHPELSGLENSSRTDYIINGPDDCLIGMSVRGCGPTDRAFMARTIDGGATFNFVSWINPEADCSTRGVMPSTVRISENKLVTTLRRKYPGEWIDAFVSYDNGNTWTFLSKVADTHCCNGNPPALVRLRDGRLCCAYGNRLNFRIEARFSEDEGLTWSDEIVLRDDYQTDAYGDADLGYCRMVQRPDGKLVTMYYWATPQHPTHHIAATIWDPGGYFDPNLAWDPSPHDGAENVARDVVPSWQPGDNAVWHDVYFGTDLVSVTDANTASPEYQGRQGRGEETYDPCGLLEMDTWYYWRIDEVNGTDTWEGDVWNFRTVGFVVVDDMEAYDDDTQTPQNPIASTWIDGWWNYTGSEVFLEFGSGAIIHNGAKAMKFIYDCNYPSPWVTKYAEIHASTATGQRNLGFVKDWTVDGLKVLTLFFHGDPDNGIEPMYVALEETPGNICVSNYGAWGQDINDIKQAEWHQWDIALQDFNDGGVDLTDVNNIRIGFGDRDNPTPGGSGVVFFDDIRLYPPKCIEPGPQADLSADCIVNHKDLRILAAEWLETGQLTSDLYADAKIDFRDYAVLANSWLENTLWP